MSVLSITNDELNIDPFPSRFRLTTSKVGDLIEVKEGVVGMIERRWIDMGGFHVCVGGRSVFMREDHISISGGPFRVIPFDKVEPTCRMEEAPCQHPKLSTPLMWRFPCLFLNKRTGGHVKESGLQLIEIEQSF